MQEDKPIIDSGLKTQYLPIQHEHKQLLSILNSIDETIYISDQKTYEILYVNRALEKKFGKVLGQICYRTLQGRDEPCEFCTNHLIFKQPYKPHIWEFKNLKTGRWHRCIDQAIRWSNGQMVRYEMAIDIHDQKMAEAEIRQNLNKQKLLTRLSNDFLHIQDFSLQVKKCLQELGEFMAVSRVYIFEDYADGQKTRNTYEWCKPGIESQAVALQAVDYNDIPSWKNILLKEGWIACKNIDELPKDLKPILHQQGIFSILVLPIFISGQFCGFIGFDECHKYRQWHERDIHLLQTISNIISIAFERHRTEEEKAAKENQFRSIFDLSMDAIAISDLNGYFKEVNQTMIDSLGYSREELQKMHATETIPQQVRPHMNQRRKKLANQELPPIETEAICKSGKRIPIELKSRLIDYMGEKSILSIVHNISDRKELERKIMATIIETEEREKQRFAIDLHDGLGPLLSAMKLYVDMLNPDQNQFKNKKIINKLYEIIDEGIEATRTIANNISPRVLSDFGLSAAIKAHCKRLNASKAIHITFDSTIKERLAANIEIALFRVVNELINNTLKHAKASKIEIHLCEVSDNIELQFYDNGKGFDLEEKTSGGFGYKGLSNIKTRIESLHGQLKFESVVGIGTRLQASIPIKQTQNLDRDKI